VNKNLLIDYKEGDRKTLHPFLNVRSRIMLSWNGIDDDK